MNTGSIVGKKYAIFNYSDIYTVTLNDGSYWGAVNGEIIDNRDTYENATFTTIKAIRLSEDQIQKWGDSQDNQLFESSNFIATNSADTLTLNDLTTTKNLTNDFINTNQLINSNINYLNMNTGSNEMLNDSQLNKVTSGVKNRC